MGRRRTPRPLRVCCALALAVAACSNGSGRTSEPTTIGPSGTDGNVSSSTSPATPSSLAPSSAPSTTVEALDFVPTFEPAPCPVEPAPGLTVECGTVRVPIDRSRPEAGEVTLAVARVRSPSPAGAADPVVWVTGGPGGAALDRLERSPDDGGLAGDPLLGSHDLVFIDQRGTGSSLPLLDCPDHDEALWAMMGTEDSFVNELELLRNSLAACRDNLLQQGVDLSAYDTVAVAADFDDVRRALEIESWGVYALSYGTLVAQEILRSHSDSVRAVVLDSVVPVDKTELERQVTGVDSALDSLLTSCETSPDCASRYPNIRSRLGDVVADYDATPLEVAVDDRNGTARTLTITGADVFSGFIAALSSTDQLANIPLFIELTEQRSPVVQSAVAQLSASMFASAEAMRDAVNCRDRFHDVTTSDLAELVRQRPEMTTFLIAGSWAACETWNVGSVPDSFHKLVESSIPTLVLAGRYDPQTPPSDGRLVADHLGNATFVEFDATSHVAYRTNPCANDLVTTFLDTPDEALDTSCTAQLPVINFTG